VIASGKTHRVRDFVDTAFSLLDLDYLRYVRTDPQLFRPSEKVQLCGDASKAKTRLGWSHTMDFSDIVRLMVEGEMSLHTKCNQ